MQGRIASVEQRWRVLLPAAALLGVLLLSCSNASAKIALTIAFTSSPPSSAVAGESYEVSATSSSGEPRAITVEGACSFTQPSLEHHLRTQVFGPHPVVTEFRTSPVTVYFTGAGTCSVAAVEACSEEYECGKHPPQQISQQFTVGRDPSDQITFTSIAPRDATVGGSYVPAVRSSAAVDVWFSSATRTVCTIHGVDVSFISAGVCTIDVVQEEAIREARATPEEIEEGVRANPEAQQSFTVRTLATSNAEKLAGALKACRKDLSKQMRGRCKAAATKKYAVASRGRLTTRPELQACLWRNLQW